MYTKIAILMGGFTAERHISLESGRNIYHKLAASGQYELVPLFLSGSMEHHQIFKIPLTLLLKDNADDVDALLQNPSQFKALKQSTETVKKAAGPFIQEYIQVEDDDPLPLNYAELKSRFDFVFLALHGGPGEDGTLQKILEEHNLPYNGSGIQTSALTINKYATNQFLKKHGFDVAEQCIITHDGWQTHSHQLIKSIEEQIDYPMIIKPVDDGCSHGVTYIANQENLKKRLHQGLVHKNSQLLIESFLGNSPTGGWCMEITVGLLTHLNKDQTIHYEIFPPSEVLAVKHILSLEEKFLAGQGHNITPARFHHNPEQSKEIEQQIQEILTDVAKKLNLQGYARIDGFVKMDPQGKMTLSVVEVNNLPAMTPATCFFHQAALHGYTPLQCIESIIAYGMQKNHFTSSIWGPKKRPL